jgi:hypothetical protein
MINAIMPADTGIEYRRWSASGKHTNGGVEQYDGVLYICRESGTTEVPGVGVKWDKYVTTDEYLRTMIDATAAKVVTRFLQEKTEDKSTKSLLENKMLYAAGGLLGNIITDSDSRLVGFYVMPKYRHRGVTVKINAIGTQTRGGSGNVTVYVFHSSQPSPLRTLSLKITKDGFAKFNVDDLLLPYDSDEINAGGSYFICYKQDELPFDMNAVNINHDWSKPPCPTCGKVNAATWATLSKYVEIAPFFVDVESNWSDNPEMFDMSEIVTTPNTCYGLNMEFSVECDLTDFIISQRSIFASVMQLQLCCDAMRAVAYNPNANVDRVVINATRQDIVLELDGNTYTRSGGLTSRLDKAYKTLSLDADGMDGACLACSHKGVKIGIA